MAKQSKHKLNQMRKAEREAVYVTPDAKTRDFQNVPDLSPGGPANLSEPKWVKETADAVFEKEETPDDLSLVKKGPHYGDDFITDMRASDPDKTTFVRATPGFIAPTKVDPREALEFIGANLDPEAHQLAPPDDAERMDERVKDLLAPREARIEYSGAGKSLAFEDRKARINPNQIRMPSMKDLIAEFGELNIPHVMEKAMSEMQPELMQRYYPRIYEQAGAYHSPKICAAYLANTVSETGRIGYDRAPAAYRLMLPAIEPMAERKMPMFFIAPDLLKAIQLTDFADDIDWTTLKLPYEQGLFVLPKGALAHEADGEVSMIMWARFRKGVPYPAPPTLGWPPTTIGHDAFTLIGLCVQSGMWYDSTFNANVRPTVRLHNLFYRTQGERTPPAVKFTRLDEDLTERDEEFLEKLGVVVFGTFLAMNAKPELLEKGKLLKRVVKAGTQPREFWSPNVIGPRYRLKREVPRIDKHGKFAADQAKRPLGGTHASPRLHWRRGHFRNQPYGSGLKERKQIWIEPVIVGAQTEDNLEASQAGA